ncbi:hypothetical protein BaRGS_00005198 [Batillaria attramentaria]|uniref:LEM domain-containing protein n=1 Tax=Batillaria attramentaria TaxID=370345 RepID=A0ABD0LVJ5_9CAEN
MPPLRQLPDSITSLSDQELADKLREYGVALGPILPTTRRVYERKLAELETGQKPPPSTGYAPVDNDEDDEEDDNEADTDSPDEEVQIKHQPRQRMTRTTRSETHQTTRREVGKPSPRKPLHAEMEDPPVRASRSSQSQKSSSKGGLPLWVKFLAIIIVAVLVFLVFKNMESDPASTIPDGNIELEV